MSIRTVAGKDVADAGRSKSLWAVTLVVVLFTAGLTGLIGATGDETATQVFAVAFRLAVVALPIVALILGKGAITGERESGSLRMLLSLPPSRREILVGKLLGRTTLMVIATLTGALATGLVVLALFSGGLAPLVPFILFLGCMGVAFVSIGVGISAGSSSDSRATAVAVGAYLVLVALWKLIYGVIEAAAREVGLIAAGSQPAWLQFIGVLPPNRAAVAAFTAATSGGSIWATDPFSSVWLPALILLGWLVVPVVAGHRRFQSANIG